MVDTEYAVTMMNNATSETINFNRINGVSCNVIFLCDVRDGSNDARLDLRRDGLGVWIDGHSRPKIPFYGNKRSDNDICDTFVWRQSFTCKSYRNLRRTEIYRRKKNSDGTPGDVISPLFMQYLFEGPPQSFDIAPHENATSELPFFPADRTLLGDISRQAEESTLSTSNLYNKVSKLIALFCLLNTT